ncbi:serine/threonine protein kinase [Nannocystaceae bacterium ST9]
MSDAGEDEPDGGVPLWDRLLAALGERDALSLRAIVSDVGGSLPPPVLLDRFEVLRHVGEGGMGTVFQAFDPKLGRCVALKLCKAAALDVDAATAIEHEARCLAKLSHPNVVAVHEVVQVEHDLVLVMEYVEGQTLRRWRRESNPNWRAVLDRYLDAGRALAAVHAAGLEHRDFKPDNVLIGEDERVHVVDFGVARDSTSGDGAGGTWLYMAPERLRGEPCGPLADQFSFCVSVWESVFGSRPFAGRTVPRLLDAIESGELAAPRWPGHGVPASVRGVLVKGLCAIASDRHESMDALLEALREAIEGQERRAERRRWQGVIVGFATLTAAIFVMGLRLASVTRPSHEPEMIVIEPELGPVDRDLESALREVEAAPEDAVQYLRLALSRARREHDEVALRRVAEVAEQVGELVVERDVDQAILSWEIACEIYVDLGDRQSFDRIRATAERLTRD